MCEGVTVSDVDMGTCISLVCGEGCVTTGVSLMFE